MLSAKQTERLSQIRLNLSVSAAPSHLPRKGRLWVCAAKAKSLPHQVVVDKERDEKHIFNR